MASLKSPQGLGTTMAFTRSKERLEIGPELKEEIGQYQDSLQEDGLAGQFQGYQNKVHPVVQHGFYHMQGNSMLEDEEAACHLCQVRKFKSCVKNNYHITITNEVDNTWMDKNFKFIEERILSPEVQKYYEASKGFELGCDCKSDDKCALYGCQCLGDLQEDKVLNTLYKTAYYVGGPREGLLREEILDMSNEEIYECSDLCGCSQNCPNRVAGRGRKFDIEIFRTSDNRGWGM